LIVLTANLNVVDQIPAQNLTVGSLDPSFYFLRSNTSAAHVQVLVEAAATAELPPILVQKEGLRIIDGLHRFHVAQERAETHIKARVLDCSDGVALVLAIKANTAHGLPFTKADRIAGARRILAEHPDWSDRAVAKVAGLSAKSIALLRDREESPESESPGKRLGRDGKHYPVNGTDGRKRVVDYISAYPNASIRQIAGEVGVSLGTVHDVRDRIRRGVDPLDNGARQERRPPVTRTQRSASREAGATLRRNPRRPTWTELGGKLASDPALRYNEDGRAFVRWLGQHSATVAGGQKLVDAIPSHWLGEIGLLADGVIEEWRLFAEQLRQREQELGKVGIDRLAM
jgi:hypothetical protein